jgi:hypothetical protein
MFDPRAESNIIGQPNSPLIFQLIATFRPDAWSILHTIIATKETGGSTWFLICMRSARRKRPFTYSASRSSRERRRALEMLAGTRRGLTEHFLLTHGFSVETLSSLALAKLVIVVTEPMTAHRAATFMVERIRITDAGRMSLEG